VPGGLIALHDVTPDWEGPYRVWNEHARAILEDAGSCSTLAYGRKPRMTRGRLPASGRG
jgi:hypothetical protein